MHLNIEFKARVADVDSLEARLQTLSPRFVGTDHQVDTYFNIPHGRLKLREGTIEYALIHYQRHNMAGAKQSDVILYQPQPDPALKAILTAALGIKAVVDKQRNIYFIDNVKFHFDTVQGLGRFLEVEAIDTSGNLGRPYLQEQCDYYARFFEIDPAHYLSHSYSDMILDLANQK